MIAAFLSLGERLVRSNKHTRPAYGVSPFPSKLISGGVSIATSFLVPMNIVQQKKLFTLKRLYIFEKACLVILFSCNPKYDLFMNGVQR
ncbi:MAG: hypothetical protein RIR73_573 [Chloroflexota bacterium]|jgi:hypothetical protein